VVERQVSDQGKDHARCVNADEVKRCWVWPDLILTLKLLDLIMGIICGTVFWQ
jgi:hypothetical protein